MDQRSTRDAMLTGAADILGEKLADAMVRVAELEAQLKKNNHHLAKLVNGTDEDNPQTYRDAVAQVIETRAVLAKGREG